ncbi:hypothetical protein BC833DRAFT_623879 [Globomyces pollinis-pini]|nr:hypothetical protein BC833DRAFT_623879 [Globomyces pollinis-pini]
MSTVTLVSSILFIICTSIVCLFHLALTFGAPWGSVAMGGKYPGVLPMKIRLAILVNQVIYIFFGIVILSRAELILPGFLPASRIIIWIINAFLLLGLFMNMITPSKWERIIWVPILLIMNISCLLIAIN